MKQVQQVQLSNGVVLFITTDGDKIVWVSEHTDTCPLRISMHRIVYSIAGDPKPLMRPRVSSRGTRWHFYDPSADVKRLAGITLQRQHGDRPAYTGPLGLFITFYFPIGKTMRKKLKPEQWHIKRPDNSNCVKLIEDICQEIGMFKDDAQIARIFSDKVYDHSPRTEFIIHELGPQRTLAVDYGAL